MSSDVVALMLFFAQEGRCFHCDEPFEGKGHGKLNKRRRRWTRDHIKLACDGHGTGRNINGERGNRPMGDPERLSAAEKERIIGFIKADDGGPRAGGQP